MKKCVVVSDSFKGTLSSQEICRIAEACVHEVFPACEVVAVPVADGGEGTVESCLAAAAGAGMSGERETVSVQGPFGEKVEATYALLGAVGGQRGACRMAGDGRGHLAPSSVSLLGSAASYSGQRVAVIEAAQAAGLPLALASGRLDPLAASTFGAGELAADALAHGADHLVVALGGSATNDGACGFAAALGVRFYDKSGAEFVPAGGTLQHIERIDVSPAREKLAGARVTAMVDVDNPLLGPRGAARVFAPQKGASEKDVELLEQGLAHLADVLDATPGTCVVPAAKPGAPGPLAGRRRSGCDGFDIRTVPGGGAAGGMGAGLLALLGAELRPGIECMLDLMGFDALIEGADLVITGEGHLDMQTLSGKVVAGVARRARAASVPVLALVGGIAPELDREPARLRELGVTAAISINRRPEPLDASAPHAAELYRAALANVLELMRAVGR